MNICIVVFVCGSILAFFYTLYIYKKKYELLQELISWKIGIPDEELKEMTFIELTRLHKKIKNGTSLSQNKKKVK